MSWNGARRTAGIANSVGIDGRTIRGYAVVFGTLSADLGGWREPIEPAAVDRTIAEALDVRALVDHDPSKVLGRTKAGTLQLAKDAHGLAVRINPPDTTTGRDVLALVERGDVSGMSFSFPRDAGRRAVRAARRDAGAHHQRYADARRQHRHVPGLHGDRRHRRPARAAGIVSAHGRRNAGAVGRVAAAARGGAVTQQQTAAAVGCTQQMASKITTNRKVAIPRNPLDWWRKADR